MHELTKVTLGNEMDLVLAHKRSMKLAEIAGLSVSAQTTFATAVSEVSRTAIGSSSNSCLVLSVDPEGSDKFIVASIKHEEGADGKRDDGLNYASRLVDKYSVSKKGLETIIDLYFGMPPSLKVDIHKLDEWRRIFRNEPPVSAYDEIKRKNEELQEMAEKVKVSEAQYKMLTNTLPLIIFSMDEAHQVTYANEWLYAYTGLTIEELNKTSWASIIHPEDTAPFYALLAEKAHLLTGSIKLQCRLRYQSSGHYLWHLVSLSPLKDNSGVISSWIGFMADINAQKVFEETLRDNKQLKEAQQLLKQNEIHLQEKIGELNRSNHELQQFAYVASHDLQEPVRKLMFFADYLLAKCEPQFEGKGVTYLHNMITTSKRMRDLIRDLLTFSQINLKDQKFIPVDLNGALQEALQDLELIIADRHAAINTVVLPSIEGDGLLLRQLFLNIISNSIKYAREGVAPVITLSQVTNETDVSISFCDNGIGFDEKYIDKMFTLFQRLHSREKYAGTGLGLAICRKIAEAHGGDISAKGSLNEGACFTITLPLNQSK
jgi:hypothetical protein